MRNGLNANKGQNLYSILSSLHTDRRVSVCSAMQVPLSQSPCVGTQRIVGESRPEDLAVPVAETKVSVGSASFDIDVTI